MVWNAGQCDIDIGYSRADLPGLSRRTTSRRAPRSKSWEARGTPQHAGRVAVPSWVPDDGLYQLFLLFAKELDFGKSRVALVNV